MLNEFLTTFKKPSKYIEEILIFIEQLMIKEVLNNNLNNNNNKYN